MSRYKRYERYKDSGVEWIGEIPEHWICGKLGYLLIKNDSGTWGDDYDDDGVVVLRSTEITLNGTWSIVDPAQRRIPVKEYERCLLHEGDLILTKSSGSEQHIGKTVIVDKNVANMNCVFSNFMQRLRPEKGKLMPKYLYYFLNANGREQLFHLSTTTTGLKNLSGTTINALKIQLPTMYEQKAIANFLDQKTAEIDGLIADKEKLIELLQEKRQAVITEAVTKGLNPNVRMKDSGSEWIGEIPEHWSIIKMKYLLSSKKYSIKAGPFGSQLKNDDMVSGDIKVYNQKTVLDNDFKSGDYYIENCKYEELRAFEVFSGDLLVTTRGTIGKTAIVPKDAEKGILHPCLIKITLNPDKVLNDYVNVIFNNTKIVTNQIMLESNATTIDVIYTDTLKNLVLPIPPLEEQKSIIDFVDAKIGEIDGLISSINSQIQKLKEYRQSLISEAVTGKIDVRVFENKDEVIYSEQDSSPCRELTHVAE
ncbi:restriction endonuclease subunit S [Thermoclostridium caenicola]|uniref:Type I restriction enzyme, S subunit n=1 Tax=Thermoclostridium caenicola TaxID=659425 RepID=A0A1M6J5N6_9FIRM|nr:restriction endonuclease subunit S [Thermoclostridium caenicola]SHJ42006.1 type I restriction enzyme, S subunit [Thermoclostridium caenicola]